ncbi:hypothetical protein CMV_026931, partial [Castanea mollissima]
SPFCGSDGVVDDCKWVVGLTVEGPTRSEVVGPTASGGLLDGSWWSMPWLVVSWVEHHFIRSKKRKADQKRKKAKYRPKRESEAESEQERRVSCHRHNQTAGTTATAEMGYIGAHGVAALHRYKYNGVDHSYIAKYVLQPFWSRFVHFFPLWMP